MNPRDKLTELLQRQEELHPELKASMDMTPLGQRICHPLIIEIFYVPQHNALYNERLAEKKRVLIKYTQAGNWSGYIWAHERPFRMNAFLDIQNKLTDKEYWEILSMTYCDSENIFQSPFMENLLKSSRPDRDSFMEDNEKAFYDALPNEVIAYRGFPVKGTRRGFSWTFDYGTAYFFANRSETLGQIVRAKIRKEDIIGVLLRRHEAEIVVPPSAIKKTAVVQLPEKEDWLQVLWKECRQNRFMKTRRTHHGPRHWEKVDMNGIHIAKKVQCDLQVVRAFAALHDCQRINEMDDPEHGPKAALFARKLFVKKALPLTDSQMDLLDYACTYHTNGAVALEPTIGACWDADRLDLIRVGIVPERQYFSSEAAFRLAFLT